jgi:hypothetical protein
LASGCIIYLSEEEKELNSFLLAKIFKLIFDLPMENNNLNNNSTYLFSSGNKQKFHNAGKIRVFLDALKSTINLIPGIDNRVKIKDVNNLISLLENFNIELALFEDNLYNLFLPNER